MRGVDFASREREVFGALYRQYACVHEAGPEDTYMNVPRLCLATHAVDHASRSSADGTMAAFSVTLANSTDLLRVIVSWPKLLERDPYGRRNWQTDVLAPLSSLAGVREVWLADVDVITDQWCDMPIWNFADPVDLVRGRHETPPDTGRRMYNFGQIRQGQDPTTQYKQQQTTVQSSVSQ